MTKKNHLKKIGQKRDKVEQIAKKKIEARF